MNQIFLPINKKEASARGWHEVDFVFASGDAYVDHPSFGAAIIGRMLEAEGYRVGLLPQPDFTKPDSFAEFGRPRYGFFVSGGVVDSMVAHYTVAKRRRSFDEYTPGGKTGKRPDRVVDVYTRLIKQAYPGIPVVVGGVEASLRRFAHYDYWDDAVLPSILATSGADMVSFGMGERSVKEIARRLAEGEAIASMQDIPGTAFLAPFYELPKKYEECASLHKVQQDKTAYARACRIQLDNQDPVRGVPVVQKHGDTYLVQNPPAKPLGRKALDEVYTLPFTRRWHPAYDAEGGVPALEEVEFSIAHNRGCFGGCNFCAIALHQGRQVTSRSVQSVVNEAKQLTAMPGFKGYIHDVGGPTANFRLPSCAKQGKDGMCAGGRNCLTPSPCPHLILDHSEYLAMLREVRALPGVKKVFIRSGIRYDYLVHDKDESFFKELVQHHVSGQLKVAPEHCSPGVLKAMAKPPIEVYNKFAKRFYELTQQAGKPQYLVPYLISSHPGSTLKDAVALAEYLHDNRMKPEQVQDFYPTPGTVSTCMYHTGLDPYTLQPVYVAKEGEQKAMQRALLQFYDPKNNARVKAALRLCHREDLAPKLLPYKDAQQLLREKQQAGKAKQKSKGGKASHGDRTSHGDKQGRQSRGRKEAPRGRQAQNKNGTNKRKGR